MQYPFAHLGSLPNLRPIPHYLLGGGEGGKRESLDSVPALFSNIQNTSVINTFYFFFNNPQIQNTALVQAAMRKVNAIPACPVWGGQAILS